MLRQATGVKRAWLLGITGTLLVLWVVGGGLVHLGMLKHACMCNECVCV
jgi:hypothetical protein